jgi:hypothetical protein
MTALPPEVMSLLEELEIIAPKKRGRRAAGEIGGKWCINCFAWKPIEQFYKKVDLARRVHSYQSRCRACNAEVVTAWRNARRAEMRVRIGLPPKPAPAAACEPSPILKPKPAEKRHTVMEALYG